MLLILLVTLKLSLGDKNMARKNTYWQGKMRKKTSDSMQALCERVAAENEAAEKKRELLKKAKVNE